ncbi:hypothetical protein GCM10011521_01190 [Arenimonas soli]|uniref:Uncharacterized protein n=1 Tax=Arenimonas soli TaxID=2269504 RepID=A0ABQ1H9H9_9GAMM|nr:hypothetical protein [Arenimonas soli]GGA66833.1 hypothetical protein GCM10011521_01190 [Arenimonas soli]
MNVFVLCTGRCGSVSFARASAYLTNYTAGQESRDKSRPVRMSMEDHESDLPKFRDWIGGEGDLDRAMNEWRTPHNKS